MVCAHRKAVSTLLSLTNFSKVTSIHSFHPLNDLLVQVNGIVGTVLHHLVRTLYTKSQKELAGCPGHGSAVSKEAKVVWACLAVGCLRAGNTARVPVTGSQKSEPHSEPSHVSLWLLISMLQTVPTPTHLMVVSCPLPVSKTF